MGITTFFIIMVGVVVSPFVLLPSVFAFIGRHEHKAYIIALNFLLIAAAIYSVVTSKIIISIVLALACYLALFRWAVTGEKSN